MAFLLPGYPGVIWNTILATLAYGNANISATKPVPAKALAESIAASLKNGVSAIDANITAQGLTTLYANLAPVVALPIFLDQTTAAFITTRLAALQQAALSATALAVYPTGVGSLAANQPSIPDPGYAEWMMGATFETSPTDDPTQIVVNAQACATAWTTVLNALKTQGVAYSGVTLNTINLMVRVTQIVANLVANATPSVNAVAGSLWNQIVAMPTLTRLCDVIMNDPTSQTAQATAVARYATLNALRSYNRLILTLRDLTVTSNLRLGTLKMGDRTLLTFAARELNDYSQWQAIAQLNNLEPPYISSTPGPGLAVPGQQLLLPPPVGAVTPVPPSETTPAKSYLINYLGVDRYLGPLNQPMLPWQGDYQVISGYQNLAISLGRRLQTTMGNLIYHTFYGSRIPPELGAVASDSIADILSEYTISALLSDPRVNSVLSCTTQFLSNYSVAITAVVLPNGIGQSEVTVNEVIGPA